MNMAISDSDNALLRAWRRGELDPGQTHAFETRLFLEPDLVEAARLDQAMAEAMPAAVEPARIAAAPATPRPWRAGGPWSLLLAASVGALAVLPFALDRGQSPMALGNLELISVDVRRSSTSEPLLVAPRAGAQLVALEVPAPGDLVGPYTLSLVTLDAGAAALSVGGLQASDGRLSLAFAREALAAGDYRIEIMGAGGQRADSTSLRIRYRPGGG